jgi:hypothetical protein
MTDGTGAGGARPPNSHAICSATDVGLLGGQTALLVGAGRRIADGEDVVVVARPEGVVDEDEAVAVARDARAVRTG